ncbi:hypothetical protein K2173_000084 [Erythroxylum novogranatense]|uniref:SGNH hydrolase-type esterase domain-containing protein n=1 Tax=Erythroxylum novogranatense TaxID=1862640 RepID=A0AAV8SP69_9ROSI|nr:hypothetical protein K2173_000084 [Erythroxylum novogranatense]
MVGPSRPQFVIFGSSIVQFSYSQNGWGAMLADIYSRKADILLRGYSGWNSSRALQVIDKVFPKDAPIQPSLVIVYFGGNDSTHPHPTGFGPHVPLPEYSENMRKIAKHLKSLSENIRIIFLNAPPINEKQMCKFNDEFDEVRTNESLRLYAQACLEVAKEMNIKAIDLWTVMQQKENWKDVCFTDGVHLSAEGSKIVLGEIMKVIKGAEWKPSLHWKSMPTEFSEDSPYDPVNFQGKPVNISDSVFHRDMEVTE